MAISMRFSFGLLVACSLLASCKGLEQMKRDFMGTSPETKVTMGVEPDEFLSGAVIVYPDISPAIERITENSGFDIRQVAAGDMETALLGAGIRIVSLSEAERAAGTNDLKEAYSDPAKARAIVDVTNADISLVVNVVSYAIDEEPDTDSMGRKTADYRITIQVNCKAVNLNSLDTYLSARTKYTSAIGSPGQGKELLTEALTQLGEEVAAAITGKVRQPAEGEGNS